MDDAPSALDTRDAILELADRYETVVALDIVPEVGEKGRTPPGSRVPPGMQQILDDDEIAGVVVAVDEWALFLVHVLMDERDLTPAEATPARLRQVARDVEHFVSHPDEMLALSVVDDLRDHLRDMRRLSKRGVRKVRTGMRCEHRGCQGQLISPLGGNGDRTDDALECDRCHNKVPYMVWSSWPRARITYVTIEHAARIAGTTVPGVKMRASRNKWRRIGTGRDIRYHVDDVRRSAGMLVA